MNEHTPGPWVYDPREVKLVAPEVAPMGIKTGALIWGGPCNSGPSPADGRLIAAAPDMLEALRELVDFGASSVALENARAAIAKATGSARLMTSAEQPK